MRKALLIVDLQNQFINKHTQHIPSLIQSLLEKNLYPLVLFSQFINSPSSSFVKYMDYTACSKPPYTEIVHELRPWLREDNVFVKQTYSVFHNPNFLAYLKKYKATELAIAGLDTDFCVLADSFNAFDLGFKVTVIGNCCASSTSGEDGHKAALQIIKGNIGEIINL